MKEDAVKPPASLIHRRTTHRPQSEVVVGNARGGVHRQPAARGWRVPATRYDDGGFTAATWTGRRSSASWPTSRTEGRLHRRLQVDRLSRSLIDFARIMDVLERHNVTFRLGQRVGVKAATEGARVVYEEGCARGDQRVFLERESPSSFTPTPIRRVFALLPQPVARKELRRFRAAGRRSRFGGRAPRVRAQPHRLRSAARAGRLKLLALSR